MIIKFLMKMKGMDLFFLYSKFLKQSYAPSSWSVLV